MTRLIAGGYAEAGAAGLYLLRLEAGALAVDAPVLGVVNVSGGVRVPGTDRWFLVDERAGQVVLVDDATEWTEIARVGSGGEGPCHLALALDGGTLAVANYDSGHVAVLAIGADGLPGDPVTHCEGGHGPNVERQDGPHAHWVGHGLDERLYATDLGTDRVLAFRSDRLDDAIVVFGAPPGSGPRQIVFHPNAPRAYLVSELASTLTVLHLEAESWRMVATLSTLPADAADGSLGGAVAINETGRRLYVSNRGHDSIATFALNAEGDATAIGHVASGGASPRFLLLADGYLLVAHEQAGGVTLLPLDDDGRPTLAVARAEVPGAAFLGMVE